MSKILLVEDNKISQRMMYYTMRSIGLKTDLAEDGQQAVEMALNNNYSLILMDISMPILDGYSSTKSIRKNEENSGHKSFIIGLTCNVYDQERDKCIEAGMDEYMPKPFDVDLFKKIITSHNVLDLF